MSEEKSCNDEGIMSVAHKANPVVTVQNNAPQVTVVMAKCGFTLLAYLTRILIQNIG